MTNETIDQLRVTFQNADEESLIRCVATIIEELSERDPEILQVLDFHLMLFIAVKGADAKILMGAPKPLVMHVYSLLEEAPDSVSVFKDILFNYFFNSNNNEELADFITTLNQLYAQRN